MRFADCAGLTLQRQIGAIERPHYRDVVPTEVAQAADSAPAPEKPAEPVTEEEQQQSLDDIPDAFLRGEIATLMEQRMAEGSSLGS